jgi:hypothetical protein
MSAHYDPSQWGDFAIATAGAAAALAGLLVVAISINVREILAERDLPTRAACALVVLSSPLVTALLVLVPGQSADALGIELISFGVLLGVALVPRNLPFRLPAQRTMSSWLLAQGVPILAIVAGTTVAGIGMVTGSLGGLYWLVPAVIAAIAGGLIQAWVLLIEILR